MSDLKSRITCAIGAGNFLVQTVLHYQFVGSRLRMMTGFCMNCSRVFEFVWHITGTFLSRNINLCNFHFRDFKVEYQTAIVSTLSTQLSLCYNDPLHKITLPD